MQCALGAFVADVDEAKLPSGCITGGQCCCLLVCVDTKSTVALWRHSRARLYVRLGYCVASEGSGVRGSVPHSQRWGRECGTFLQTLKIRFWVFST